MLPSFNFKGVSFCRGLEDGEGGSSEPEKGNKNKMETTILPYHNLNFMIKYCNCATVGHILQVISQNLF